MKKIQAKAKKIKMLIMDVDGTLTDGKIYIGPRGEVFKAFNTKDGLGIKLLIDKGIIPVIITGRNSEIVVARAEELGIDEIHQGIEDKLDLYQHLVEKYKLNDEEVAFIGDDLNDLPLLNKVGLSFCVADAVEAVREKVDYVARLKGGEGAVREAIDVILGWSTTPAKAGN